MSGSDPKEKRRRAMIWFLGISLFAVFGAVMQDKPITIAASDHPPTISTPVTSTDASRTSMPQQATSMRQRETRSGVLPPLAQPGTQIFYGGWTVPQ